MQTANAAAAASHICCSSIQCIRANCHLESSCSVNVFPYFYILLAVIVVTTGVRISALKSNAGLIVCYHQSVVTN